MNISIRSVHFTADEKLLKFTEQKFSKIEKYFNGIVSIDVSLKLENLSQKIKDKVAEVKIKVPGDLIVVTATSKTFEGAVESATRTVKRRIIRYKEKLRV
jgi:putative sigma-54 modulation protein